MAHTMSQWLNSFDTVFLALDRSGTIQNTAGPTNTLLGVHADALQDLSWQQFIEQYASEPAREGLEYGWMAIAGSRVDSAHWPDMFPFRDTLIARLKPAPDAVEHAFIVQLVPSGLWRLHTGFIDQNQPALERLTRLSQRALRGLAGPLTDMQNEYLQSITTTSEQIYHEHLCLYAEHIQPAITAPRPCSLAEIFQFTRYDFYTPRLLTHRLSLAYDLPPLSVYIWPTLRTSLQHLLSDLLSGITTASAITLSAHEASGGTMVEVVIRYHTDDPALNVTPYATPADNRDVKPDTAHPVEKHVTLLRAQVQPVGGDVWVEPVVTSNDATTQLALQLPRWRDSESVLG